MSESFQQQVWHVVSQIPHGKVASYGQVARYAGAPNAARQVGQVLRKLPSGSKLPWHRVINSQGKISLPVGSPSHDVQKERLTDEGVVFNNNKIKRSFFIP